MEVDPGMARHTGGGEFSIHGNDGAMGIVEGELVQAGEVSSDDIIGGTCRARNAAGSESERAYMALIDPVFAGDAKRDAYSLFRAYGAVYDRVTFTGPIGLSVEKDVDAVVQEKGAAVYPVAVGKAVNLSIQSDAGASVFGDSAIGNGITATVSISRAGKEDAVGSVLEDAAGLNVIPGHPAILGEQDNALGTVCGNGAIGNTVSLVLPVFSG